MREMKNKADSLSDPRLIAALDTSSLDAAQKLIRQLQGLVDFYKIGFELFTAFGWKAAELVRKSGGKIFLDLKLHDIPSTVSKTAAVICEHEIEMFTVHTLGGFEMMQQVCETVEKRPRGGKKRPRILGVTILTSHTQESLSKEMGIGRNLDEQVLHLAGLAKKAGLDGVVSSPQEISLLRAGFPKDFLIVTPGIRPQGSPQGDQKRTYAPKEALGAGADFIVIGRPITAAENPRKETLNILNSLQR